MTHNQSETKKFISNIATRMESSHYGSLQCDYITEAYIGEALGGRVDEGFVDIVKAIGRGISYPIEQVKNFWKHDREFVAEVAKAEKSFPRETIAAIYSAEFADTNIVEDLWDILCMLKDVILFRYQHIPWRTAVSAAGLALYYFSPWNLTLGTALVKWLEASGGGFTGNIFGDGNAATGAEAAATTPDGVAPGETVVDVTGKGNPAGSTLPTNNPDVNVAGDGSMHCRIGEGDYSVSDGASHIGETCTLPDGKTATYVDETMEVNPYNKELTYTVPGIDTNGDGKVDTWFHPTDAQMKADAAKYGVHESVTAIATGVAAAAGAGILYYQANKAKIIAGAKVAEPYLNHLDELLIVFLLWKWFKKDLRDYRKWLAAKELVKDRKERGLNRMR